MEDYLNCIVPAEHNIFQHHLGPDLYVCRNCVLQFIAYPELHLDCIHLCGRVGQNQSQHTHQLIKLPL